MKYDIDKLITSALSGVESSLGCLLALVENDDSSVSKILEAISPRLGKAYRIGITGSPGSGKSTLIDKLVGVIRSKGLTVAVICVDPSSPVTGGAVLGDRIRMEQHYLDDEVFIRSMASRGNYGGISKAVGAAVDLFDASGKDVVIVETVGIGQEGIDIIKTVDTTVLVLAPGWGDSMQFMKAGVLEIADLIVVNKADLDADGLVDSIKDILALGTRKSVPPVVRTQAMNNIGLEELYHELEKQRNEHHHNVKNNKH
ncbi:methylmalonyl Co-A mutase-associated GTPase MeaB [Thermodesulfobacteriota bacterium]